jgi:hypothetical protein
LLPPEVLGRKRGKQLRRRLGFSLIGVVIVVGAAMALGTVTMLAAQGGLTTAQDRASALAAQQAQYSAVTKIQLDSQAIKAAQTTATVKEIAWQPYIAELQKTLTDGMAITAFDASIDPAVQPSATNSPLEGPRVATLKVTLSSAKASVSKWLISLQGLTGFVDGTPGSVARDGNGYTTDVVIHISEAALSNRYAAKK